MPLSDRKGARATETQTNTSTIDVRAHILELIHTCFLFTGANA